MPTELDDAIKEHHAKFYMAQKDLTPSELEGILPVCFPMTHQISGFPGVARYPIDEWEEAGSPMLTVTGWCVLCMKVAEKNMEDLHKVFTCAEGVKKREEQVLLNMKASRKPSTEMGAPKKKGHVSDDNEVHSVREHCVRSGSHGVHPPRTIAQNH